MMKTVTDRLGLAETANLSQVYEKLTSKLLAAFQQMTAFVRPSEASE